MVPMVKTIAWKAVFLGVLMTAFVYGIVEAVSVEPDHPMYQQVILWVVGILFSTAIFLMAAKEIFSKPNNESPQLTWGMASFGLVIVPVFAVITVFVLQAFCGTTFPWVAMACVHLFMGLAVTVMLNFRRSYDFLNVVLALGGGYFCIWFTNNLLDMGMEDFFSVFHVGRLLVWLIPGLVSFVISLLGAGIAYYLILFMDAGEDLSGVIES